MSQPAPPGPIPRGNGAPLPPQHDTLVSLRPLKEVPEVESGRSASISRIGSLAGQCGVDARTVTFGNGHCPGCDGRCGISLGRPKLAVPRHVETPQGGNVVVDVHAKTLLWGTLRVFGPPLVVVGAWASLAPPGTPDWSTAAVFGFALVATVVAGRRWPFGQ